MIFGLGAAAVLLAAAVAVAAEDELPDDYFPQQMTADALLRACASSSLTRTGRERKRYCHGFVSGVEEGVRLVQQDGLGDAGLVLCVPPGRTSREFAHLYMRYAVREAVDLGKAAALIVVEALRDAYPCPGDDAAIRVD